MSLDKLKELVRDFVHQREWDKFHSPKNVIMSLSSEVGELNDIFRWLTEDQSREIMDSPEKGRMVREEIGDVLVNLILLAEGLHIDLIEAARDKMALNEKKFPLEHWKGKCEVDSGK